MTLPLQNYVDRVGPVVSATWLNEVDLLRFLSGIDALQYPLTFVGDGSPYEGTGDIGAQINAAYAALPSTGGKIIVNPKLAGGAYNFSTPIVLNTLGKYPVIEGMAPGGASATEGCSLNYTPVTATDAITLDYATYLIGPIAPQSGLRNIALINNGITATGGAGSLATGIKIGTTNGGDSNAVYDRVMLQGFGVAYDNPNALLSAVNQQWMGCLFNANTVVLSCVGTTMRFYGGVIAGNGSIVKQKAGTSQPELYFIGTNTYTNIADPVFDCNYSVSPVNLHFVDVHFENSPALHSHYITGAANVDMVGGLMEDDNATGVSDYMIKTNDYTTISILGTRVISSRPLTCIVDMTNASRALVMPVVGSANVLALVAGTFAVEAKTGGINVYGSTPYPESTTSAVALRSALTLADPNFQSGATYTILPTDYYVNFAAACTVTLPDPVTNASRVLVLRTTTATAVISASANVIAQAGGAAGTAILAATAGKFAEMQSDGTNWVIWQSN